MEQTADNGGPAIVARGLTRVFAETRAVDGLDLEVARGEMFGLVGPDGAGKSTAIRLLCGLLKPSGGEARVLGFDLVAQSLEIKRRIGYLSQAFTLYGDLSVDENIEFFAELHGVRHCGARRNELLEFTRLAPFRARRAEALSGGMKKKLALACTLIHTPEMILLDEPSTGVDPVSRGEFWNILSGILAQGVTIVMTTPYLDEAERCDHVGLMYGGRVVRAGTPGAIRAAMPGRMLRVDCPAPREAARALRRRDPQASVVLLGDQLRLWRRPGQEADPVAAWLEADGLGPARVAETDPSLEDAFVALVSDQEQKP